MDQSIREVTTQATLEQKKRLRKEFRLFDLILFSLSALIGIDTLGAVASNGAQALIWLVISAVTFLLPYGLLVSELGSTFTQEGGVYEWCKLAGGRFFASLASIFYWISNPLWLGGTISVTAIAAIKTFWFGSPNYQFGGSNISDAFVTMGMALLFIWGTIWCSIISLHTGKWITFIGTYVKLGLMSLFFLLALVFIFVNHSNGTHLGAADFIPSNNWNLILSGILPILIFNWVGFEVPNGAGEEIVDPQRDVPRSIIRTGSIGVLAYVLPITVILLALSKEQLSNASGFVKAFQVVTTILPPWLATGLGWIVAIGVVIALSSTVAAWLIGSDRNYAIASLDRNAPLVIGTFSQKYGTPIVVNIMSGIVASLALMAAIFINAFGSGSIQSLFAIVLGFSISTTTLSYLFIFATNIPACTVPTKCLVVWLGPGS